MAGARLSPLRFAAWPHRVPSGTQVLDLPDGPHVLPLREIGQKARLGHDPLGPFHAEVLARHSRFAASRRCSLIVDSGRARVCAVCASQLACTRAQCAVVRRLVARQCGSALELRLHEAQSSATSRSPCMACPLSALCSSRTE